MASFYVVITFLTVFLVAKDVQGETPRPNVVFIIADDLGWDDVSFHGSNVTLTPNLDMLAYTGMALERHYTHCVCTPSRAALVTGKYAHTLGMQGYPLTNGEDRGLPLTEKILPEYLKELGYATHLVGKWHLGQSRTSFLPTSRGFDSHFGFRGGLIDYYEYFNEELWQTYGRVSGFDLFRNLTAAWDVKGYITKVFTDEAKSIIERHDTSTPLFLMLAMNAPHAGTDESRLQAPEETVRSLRHLASITKRMFSAMVKELDNSVGEIVEALANKGVLDNTIIVFISDNGGATFENSASNWPLKGTKFSPFEGGIRTSGLIWTNSLATSNNHLWKGYIHIVDWLPTILRAVNAEPPSGIDGKDLWTNINFNQPSMRNEHFEIYTSMDQNNFSSIVNGQYKLVCGNVNDTYKYNAEFKHDDFIGTEPSYNEAIKGSKLYRLFEELNKSFKIDNIKLRNNIRVECKGNNAKKLHNHRSGNVLLYDIINDPCETQDLSKSHPKIVKTLQSRLQMEMKRTLSKNTLFRDPRALPSLHNYTWATWADF